MDKEFFTLSEAVIWIAFRGRELNLLQKLEQDAELERAKRVLHAALCSGLIGVIGRKSPGTKPEYLIVYPYCVFDCGHNVIFYDEDIEFAKMEGRYRGDICICSAELKNFFMCSCAYCQNIGYSTPYIDIMNSVISDMNISADNQPLKKHIEAAICEKARRDGVELSEKTIAAMASLVRLPEARRGGNRKNKR